MKTLLILGIALAGVLLFLLATASANTSLFAEHYSLLLGLNAALAVALLAVVGYQLGSLWLRLKRRVFGSRLTLRFLVLFATMALVPGVVPQGSTEGNALTGKNVFAAGNYQVVATFHGNAEKRTVAIGGEKLKTVDFRWSSE